MAGLIEKALEHKQHALLEAGTGNGKTFAYLAPLFVGKGKKIISVPNKTLQGQLVNKAIPSLQETLRTYPYVVQLKGRSNYVCLLKIDELSRTQGAGTQTLTYLERVLESWAVKSDGDIDQLGIPHSRVIFCRIRE